MSNYIVHKAVEVSKTLKKLQSIFNEPGCLESHFIAQPKLDGCNTVLIKRADGITIYSRTNEEVKSLDHIKVALSVLPGVTDGVYLGEAWAHDLTFPEISGRFRKQATTEKTAQLQFVIFDYLTLEEWDAGESRLNYGDRTDRIPEVLFHTSQAKGAPVCVLQSFGRIAETWPGTTAQHVCNKLVEAGGYDGLILRDPEGTWTKGDNGAHGEIIKVKQKLSFDLRVIDYEPGKGKHSGKIGTLVVDFRGRHQGAGTGLRDSERSIRDFRDNWLDRIVEIECLGVTEDGQLREPRLKGIRYDKVEPDA